MASFASAYSFCADQPMVSSSTEPKPLQPAKSVSSSAAKYTLNMGREDYTGSRRSISRDWDESFVAPLSATVPREMGGLRLDQALARLFHQYSRNRLQAWLEQGHIKVDGKRLSPRHPVTGGERVVLEPPRLPAA